MVQEKLLTVNNLRTEFFSSKKSSVTAINEISFHIDKGEILGLVGESGCGKSVTSLSIMRLLNFTSGKVTKGEVIFEGQDLQQLPEKEMRTIRGGRVIAELKDYGGRVIVKPWLDEAEAERGNDDAVVGVVIVKRRGIANPADQLVMMTSEAFARLLEGGPDTEPVVVLDPMTVQAAA